MLTENDFKANTWESEVRDYELDAQGIVNNSCYFNYFEHARHRYISKLGINFLAWHKQGYDLVVIEANLKYKKSLTTRDKFLVTTEVQRVSRITFGFSQVIYRKSDNALVCQAFITATCVNIQTGKPCLPTELVERLGLDT